MKELTRTQQTAAAHAPPSVSIPRVRAHLEASSDAPPSRRAALGLFGVGAAVAWWGGSRDGYGASDGAPAFWVSDRAAHRVWSLDRRLLLQRSVELRSPVEVASAEAGGVWVTSQLEDWPLGAHRLVRLDADGERLAEFHAGALQDLDALGGGVITIEWNRPSNADDRVLYVDARGWPTTLFEAPDLSCVAAGRNGELLVGTRVGELFLLRMSSGAADLLAQRQVGGEIADLALGPEPGAWWVLDAHSPARLILLDSDLSERWSVVHQLSASHLVPVPDRERVWIADGSEPVVRRYGAGGTLELHRSRLPLGGLGRGLALPGGEVLLVAPGALLHLDERGELLPGQGGFAFLVGVA